MNTLEPLGPPSWEQAGRGPCAASVILPVRNNADYLPAALQSVLAETALTLDVLVLDDASTDATAARFRETVNRAQANQHRIRFWTGQPRRGLDGNLALTAAAGTDLCLVQHGDDVSEPARWSRLVETFERTGADVISTDFRLLEGQSLAPSEVTANTGFISAATIARDGPRLPLLGAVLAWRRRVMADFPLLTHERLFLGHDTMIPFRGALRGGYYHLNEPLLRYRQHPHQWSWRLVDVSSTGSDVEHKAFRHLAILRVMALDVQHIRQREMPAGVDLAALLAEIGTRQTELLEFYVCHREALLRRGQRPLWVDAEDFDRWQREVHHEQFWRHGRWRRWRRWWRERWRR